MREHDTQARAVELRPRAVLAIGITGHRHIGVEGKIAEFVTAALDSIFRRLSRAFNSVATTDAEFFSREAPALRAICMAADGADLLGAVAARNCGAEIAVILPFAVDEYKIDFAPAPAAKLFDKILAESATRFELLGTHEEGPRAYERANDVILANVDLLVAVWDGKWASGRAGTGDVVPDAVSRGIPTIVIDPTRPGTPKLLLPRADDELDHAAASDLNWRTLDDDLTALVMNQISPPTGLTRRRGLIDLLSETPRSAIWRVEHPALLRLFGAARTSYRDASSQPVVTNSAWDVAVRSAQALDRTLAVRLEELGRTTHEIDKFAAYYGQLFRSSAVSRFFLVVAVAVLSGLIGILFPSLFGASLVLQIAVSILVLIDGKIGGRRRWHERWLDYRLLTERLRGLRLLHPLGVGSQDPASSSRRGRDAWTDWYIRRTARALGAPAGAIRAPELSAMAELLVTIEIREQVDYHRQAFRQLGKLERRLALAANVALGTAIAVGAALGSAAYLFGGLEAVWWKPAASVLLAALPAAMSAFNGVRADGDLVRLVERSAMTAAALARLGRAVSRAPLTYDRLASAAARAAAIMANERSEWRFVLESRRTRTHRRQAMRRPRLARMRRLWKA